jgi:hypothetical protein
VQLRPAKVVLGALAGRMCAGKAVGRTLARLAAFAAGSRIAITYDLPAQALAGLQREVCDSLAAHLSPISESRSPRRSSATKPKPC